MIVSPQDFRSAMRQLAAAVNIVTTRGENGRAGMTATAVISLTAEPPQLGVAVNRGNASYAALCESQVFAVNVLSHDQADLAGQFAGATGKKGEERFTNGRWDTLQTGAPVLLDAAVIFDCDLVQQVELSSHALMIGQVKAVRTAAAAKPLLYMDGSWASLVRANQSDFEAYRQLVDEVADTLEQSLAGDDQPEAQLRRFVHCFAEAHAVKAGLLRDFLSRESFAPARGLDAINGRKQQIVASLQDVLRRGAESGMFTPSDPALLGHAIIGMLSSVHRWPGADPSTVGEHLHELVRAMTGQRPA